MASTVVKTIWQSKEIHEAGDPTEGVKSSSQLVPEAPGGVTTLAKGIPKKKKAVSFHTVEPRMSQEPTNWGLNLRKSMAYTNVSLLNPAATMEPTDSSGADSVTQDSGLLALSVSPASPATPWASDDPDIMEILRLERKLEHAFYQFILFTSVDAKGIYLNPQSVVNSGLVWAKDSITSLKEKTTRVNQHVQTLQSECLVLSENLERRQQEAEELEGYCSQLKESCLKVTRLVEDAEIKTNFLKQNSTLLEEKLRYLRQLVQDETPWRQEAKLQELEQKLEAGLSRHGLGSTAQPPGSSDPPGSPNEPRQPWAVAPGGWGMGPRAGECPNLRELELQKVSYSLEELRREVSSLTARWHQEEGAVQEALRLLGGLGGRLDGFLGQWEQAQREQAQTARGLEELRGRTDELCTMMERSAVSVASLRSQLEGLGPMKPILEELRRSSRRGSDLPMNLDRPPLGSCVRCPSQGQPLNTESLQQLLDGALTPLVDEVKQRGLVPACPNCQRLHKKILELERQALAKHVRAEALSSTLRLAQEEALRTKNLLLTDKMKPEEKGATLDYLRLKTCSLHDQLSNLPLEGSTGPMRGGSGGATPPTRGSPAPEE